MSEGMPPYWRTFWRAAAALGIVNIALWLCYILYYILFSPPKYGPKPIWLVPGFLLNVPGMVIANLVFGGFEPGSSADWIMMIALCQVISTVFWAGVAVGVKSFRERSVKRRAQPPGTTPNST